MLAHTTIVIPNSLGGDKGISFASQIISNSHNLQNLPRNFKALRRITQSILQGVKQLSDVEVATLQKVLRAQKLEEVKCFFPCNFSSYVEGFSGKISGDFIDVALLSREKFIIRFGDVMGHDRAASDIAYTLSAAFHNPLISQVLSILHNFYDNGQLLALAFMSELLKTNDLSFYTLTSSIVDTQKQTVTSVFAGSNDFFHVRDTGKEVLVKKTGSDESLTIFISLDKHFSSAENIVESGSETFNYQHGDYLVYLSDGITNRLASNGEILEEQDYLLELLGQGIKEGRVLEFSALAETIFHKIASQTSEHIPDDVSVVVVEL